MPSFLTRLFGRSQPGVDWIEPAELRRRLAGAAPPLGLDVREPDEFTGPLGHIEGAVNLPVGNVPARLHELAADTRPVVTVCLTDKRSAAAAAQLTEAGIGPVAVLRGGMRAWREAEG